MDPRLTFMLREAHCVTRSTSQDPKLRQPPRVGGPLARQRATRTSRDERSAPRVRALPSFISAAVLRHFTALQALGAGRARERARAKPADARAEPLLWRSHRGRSRARRGRTPIRTGPATRRRNHRQAPAYDRPHRDARQRRCRQLRTRGCQARGLVRYCSRCALFRRVVRLAMSPGATAQQIAVTARYRWLRPRTRSPRRSIRRARSGSRVAMVAGCAAICFVCSPNSKGN